MLIRLCVRRLLPALVVATLIGCDSREVEDPDRLIDVKAISPPTVVEELETGGPDPLPEMPAPAQPAEIVLEELPQSRLALRGAVASSLEKDKIENLVRKGLPEEIGLEGQLVVRAQRAPATWVSALEAFDLRTLRPVWNVSFALSNERVSLGGAVAQEAEKARIEERLSTIFERAGLAVESNLEVSSPPVARLTVWSTPGNTVLMSGALPSADLDEVRQVVSRHLPKGMRLVDDLTEHRLIRSTPWLRGLDTFLPVFFQASQKNRLHLVGTRVVVEGIAEGNNMRLLRRRLGEAFPASNFETESQLQLGMPSEMEMEEADSPIDERSFAQAIANTKIFFRSGRSRVTQLLGEEVAKLDALGKLWNEEDNKRKVYVYGFTDPSGDPETNKLISYNRCRHVVDHLVEKHGIDRDLLEVVGTPEDHTPNPNLPNSEMRRVEFSFLGTGTEATVAAVDEPVPLVPVNSPLRPVHFTELVESTKIYFGKSQAILKREDIAKLELLAMAMLVEKIEGNLAIFGYASSTGSRDANEWITEERCKAVRDQLVRFGIPEERLVMYPIMPPNVVEKPEEEDPTTIGDEAEEESEEVDPTSRRVEFALDPPGEDPGAAIEGDGEGSPEPSAGEGEETLPDETPLAEDHSGSRGPAL